MHQASHSENGLQPQLIRYDATNQSLTLSVNGPFGALPRKSSVFALSEHGENAFLFQWVVIYPQLYIANEGHCFRRVNLLIHLISIAITTIRNQLYLKNFY